MVEARESLSDTGSPVAAPGATASPGAADRRRPGRRPDVCPGLIPLLRFRPTSAAPPATDPADARESTILTDDMEDDLGTARAFPIGLLLAASIWAALLVLTWAGFRFLSAIHGL